MSKCHDCGDEEIHTTRLTTICILPRQLLYVTVHTLAMSGLLLISVVCERTVWHIMFQHCLTQIE